MERKDGGEGRGRGGRDETKDVIYEFVTQL